MSKKLKKDGRIKSAANWFSKNKMTAVEAVNKIWILIVLATLWIGAYVIYTATAETVPAIVRQFLTAGLGVLGVMFLYANLRSVKQNDVIE